MKTAHQTSAIGSFLRPYVISLAPNLYALQFRFMKVLPALYIVEQAILSGSFIPGKTKVVESSSGNFALGLALVCQYYGNRLTVVSEPSLDLFHQQRLEDLGASVSIVTEKDAAGSYQQSRLQLLMGLLSEDHTYWPRQYDEPNNPRAYAVLAEQIIEEIGEPDILVGPVGSGGSMCGTSRYLRLVNPAMKSVAVDTHGSVAFGHEDRPRLMGGLGNSIFPANLDHTTFDYVHWVTAAEGFRATRELHQTHGVYAGGSSGAAFLVANWISQKHPDEKTVVIFPDQGERYARTIYNDTWLKQNAWLDQLPSQPVSTLNPRNCPNAWSMMRWGRRGLSEVMSRLP